MDVKERNFDIHVTEMIKGAGLLLMIFHHLFWNFDHTKDMYQTFFLSKNYLSLFATLCCVCVPIFVFLSGYGLTCSINKKNIPSLQFVYRNELKLFFNYVFVFIISIIIGFLINKLSFDNTWNGQAKAIIADFFGVAYLFNLPSANDTWWYIGLTYILYLLFPIFNKLCKKNIFLFLAIILFINFFPFYPKSPFNLAVVSGYILSFGFGIFCANCNIFSYVSENVLINLVSSALLFASSLFILKTCGFIGYSFLSFAIVFTMFTLIGEIKFIKRVLVFIGKHSSTGYLIHNFILYIYLERITYSFTYPLIIFLFVSILTVIIAFGLDELKKVIKYDYAVNMLLNLKNKKK